MKLPWEFKVNLMKGVVTDEMLELCLIGVNKRAKNCRNAIRRLDKNIESYKFKKTKLTERLQYYYELKYSLLSVLNPTAIHYETYQGNSKNIDDGRQKECAYYNKQNNTTTYFYLFFETQHHSYHYPICKKDVKTYNLPMIFITDHIVTDGLNEEEMIPMEFIVDIVNMIKKKRNRTEI